MDTQVVVINLAATVFVEAETPEAAQTMVEDKLADVEAKLARLQIGVGHGDMSATKAFTEGMDPPGDEDD